MKRINEVAGHLAGDQALAALARLLRRLSRAGDVVGRFAGDAFALVLRDSKLEGPGRFAARLIELLRDQMVVGGQSEMPLRASVGFSWLDLESIPSANSRLIALPISKRWPNRCA